MNLRNDTSLVTHYFLRRVWFCTATKDEQSRRANDCYNTEAERVFAKQTVLVN